MRVRLPLGVQQPPITMSRLSPRDLKRQRFQATVLAYAEVNGIIIRDAYDKVEKYHPTLSGTFPSFWAFQRWNTRHRPPVSIEIGDILPIPTIAEDGGSTLVEAGAEDVRPRLSIHKTPHPSTREAERQDEREAYERIYQGIVKRLETKEGREWAARLITNHVMHGSV